MCKVVWCWFVHGFVLLESESLTMSRNIPISNYHGQSTVLCFWRRERFWWQHVVQDTTVISAPRIQIGFACHFFVCSCTVGVALGFQIFLRYPQSYSILVARVTGGQSGCLQAQSSQMHASRSHILSLHFKPAGGSKGLDFGSRRHQQIDAKNAIFGSMPFLPGRWP